MRILKGTREAYLLGWLAYDKASRQYRIERIEHKAAAHFKRLLEAKDLRSCAWAVRLQLLHEAQEVYTGEALQRFGGIVVRSRNGKIIDVLQTLKGV